MKLSANDKRFFSGQSAALNCISTTLAPAHIIRIATAYFEPSGFQCLQDVLAGKQVRLLVGREEGGRDRAEDVINEFVDKLTAHPLERRIRAMRLMLDALENNLLLVSVSDLVDGPVMRKSSSSVTIGRRLKRWLKPLPII